MLDLEFNLNDKEYYKEFIGMKRSDINDIREKYKILRRKAIKNLNKKLREDGHDGSIMGMDVDDDDLWKYLDGEEKMLFNKYSKILGFDWGFKPHEEKFHVKKFKELVKESKLITEGLRFNTTYLSLPEGLYNIIDVYNEVEELKNDLEQWMKEGWLTVTSVDDEHKEIIPKMSKITDNE